MDVIAKAMVVSGQAKRLIEFYDKTIPDNLIIKCHQFNQIVDETSHEYKTRAKEINDKYYW